MPKLQRIKRSNGSLVYSVNIPLGLIEELEWRKGYNLDLRVEEIKEAKVLLVSTDELKKEVGLDGTN
jgi:hypothetical protein